MSKLSSLKRSMENMPQHLLNPDLQHILEFDIPQNDSSASENSEPHANSDDPSIPPYMKLMYMHICAIRSGIETLQQSVHLLHEKRETFTVNNSTDNGELFDMSVFPLDNDKDVEDLERIFTESPETKLVLARQLSQVGGNGISDTCRRLMRKIMTDTLAQTYSYHGYKTKKSFSSLQLKDILMDAIKFNKSINCTEKDAETVFQDWLRHAKFRQTRRRD